jgi:sirohydrochlorin cobaltochelatase
MCVNTLSSLSLRLAIPPQSTVSWRKRNDGELMSRGIVLFGHGSRNAAWAEPFQLLKREVERLQPGARVELGFLELMEPSLPAAIASLADAGLDEVIIVPVFISAGSHVREDLPRLAEEAMEAHPGLRVRMVPSLGEAPEMLEAMASYALRSAGL